MTTQEFFEEFNILYNQVNSNQAPGLDKYEISVFLTQGQEDVVLGFFNPRRNKQMQGIDDSQERQYGFSTLVRNCDEHVHAQSDVQSLQTDTYDPRSCWVEIDSDVLLILNESVYKDIEGKDPEILQVVPIAYHDYERLMKKPYKYPPKNQVWRLMFDSYVEQGRNGADEYGHTFFTRVELIGSTLDDTYTYSYRYVKRPRPIVLEDLAQGLSVDGCGVKSECELPLAMHRAVLRRAVELATATYNPQNLGNLVGVGNASATDIGTVTNNDKR